MGEHTVTRGSIVICCWGNDLFLGAMMDGAGRSDFILPYVSVEEQIKKETSAENEPR